MSYLFLCSVPLLSVASAGVRAARVSIVHQVVGFLLFAAIITAAWALGARVIGSASSVGRRMALAGALLVTPFALISLLWVGLGTPWEATPTENRMRYLVLLADSIAVAGGFIVLEGSLTDAGERFYSTVGFALNVMAGAAYLIWTSVQTGAYVVLVRDGALPPAIVSLTDVTEILLFVACVLTYLATAAFALSMGRIRWLGRGATGAYSALALVALAFIIMRGPSFPDPTAGSTPWYARPGFIAGIPAVPWILPFFLGVVLLWRAGDQHGRVPEAVAIDASRSA